MFKATLQYLLLSAIVILASGCSSTPDYPPRTSSKTTPLSGNSFAHPGVRVAASMLGTPYRYGGSSPRGFDCSGLVYYSYRQAGFHVPRTTREQLRAANRIAMSQLTPGDLLFFRTVRKDVSHVAIYTGDGRFIHAPSSGKRVSYGSMSNTYWKNRLIAAGRY